MIRRDENNRPFPASKVSYKIQELTEEQKQERRKAYEKFQKISMAKAQLMSDAIGDLVNLGFDMTDMKIETNSETGDEFLKCEGEAVYKAELTRENVADSEPPVLAVTGVKGYWLKTILQPKRVVVAA